ncbi:SDR family NAD(P)-dependent oxidoreductase [Marinifilum flexuosum]|uniref:SDR family NAD(P)-dependent oxidoreductase n=1 Tax=Marinifilum flexuosum TaxID=1117708 RepID=UPI002494DE58|nr:SDR family oxidoreductase [Marinifilum flexuosum]
MNKEFILITGASSGIGKEISIQLSLNYNVVLCGRNLEKLNATKLQCSSENNSLIFQFDLSDCSNIDKALSKFMRDNSIAISHFVHCAGYMKMQPVKLLSLENLQQTFNTNVFSAALICKVLTKKKVNFSSLKSVVLISSNISDRGAKALTAYGSSKGALDSLMRCLAVELAPAVRVNSVLPGAVRTEMTENIFDDQEIASRMEKTYPLGFGYPTDIANVVDFLISEKSRWITGQQVTVDGGRTVDISG